MVDTQNNNQDKSVWRRYFWGWSGLINGLIAFVPASMVFAILRDLGLGGVLPLLVTMFGFMYAAGLVREKVSSKNKNNAIEVSKEK